MLVKELQKIYKEYKVLSVKCDEAQDAMVNDYENEALEEIADRVYDLYWNKREELVAGVMELTKVDRSVANKMIASDKFNELMKLTIA